jgi:hypothetical protein
MKTMFAPSHEQPAIRIAGSERLLKLQAVSGKCPQKESLFTLHSASGFRRGDGTIEIEKIAGYCHDRRMLRTYWLHRVHMVADAVTGEEIDNIGEWIATAELGGAVTDHAVTASGSPAAGRNAAAAIDEAVRCALEQGDRDMAERLFRIGGLLKNAKLEGSAC